MKTDQRVMYFVRTFRAKAMKRSWILHGLNVMIIAAQERYESEVKYKSKGAANKLVTFYQAEIGAAKVELKLLRLSNGNFARTWRLNSNAISRMSLVESLVDIAVFDEPKESLIAEGLFPVRVAVREGNDQEYKIVMSDEIEPQNFERIEFAREYAKAMRIPDFKIYVEIPKQKDPVTGVES